MKYQNKDGSAKEDIIIYWDSQDSTNEGAAWRNKDGSESGPLECIGWRHTDGSEVDNNGYSFSHYFDRDGKYKGADIYGIFPVFG